MIESLGALRRVAAPDLADMLAWRNAPETRRHMYTRHEISQEEHRAWWARMQSRDDAQYFIYEFKGNAAGVVGFTSIDRVSRNCAWAFYASPEAPRGSGTRMEFLALEHVFSALALHKLYCEVLSTNPSVIKLHQKFGFVVEGVFKEHHQMDGEFIDVFRLALLENDWRHHRDAMLSRILPRNG